MEEMRAVVTGGARGIGYATAYRLLREGAVVTLWDLDGEGLRAAAEELLGAAASGQEATSTKQRIFTAICDVSDPQSVSQAAEQAESEMGGIDILINNAGFMAPGFLDEQPALVWKKTVDVNLTSMLITCRTVLPGMYRRGYGHVVNISSAAGMVGVPGLAAYCAAKWGAFGLTEALRKEAAARTGGRVRFSSVHPMFLKTGMFEGARLSGLGALLFPRVESHDVIAEAIVEAALKRGRRIVRRPRSLVLVPLLRGLLPDAWLAALSRLMQVDSSMQRYRGGTQ
jgi:all-trans-retinol dehydrogenase (NAD+)